MKVSFFLSISLFWIALIGVALPTFSAQESAAGPSVSLKDLSSQIATRLSRVEEFRFIREEAEKLEVRAWLFGGTAAGFGHYVKWDLQREKGDSRFQPDRFDYDYTNIYRSTQDLDIVIDGDPEKAEILQRNLAEKFPHMQGSKPAWEVRLLRGKMGDKLPLLDNPDFMNQHTDSNSTGMIEVTQPPKGESVVRDLRDWNKANPEFLKDIREGKLHYYFSPLHESTQFYKQGRNPPILSAIRYLTKAVQYELEIRAEDRKHIEEVIQDFNPRRDVKDSYVENWIEKNGKKLIQNAVNVEYAVGLLDEFGLRKKLAKIHGNSEEVDSLAWWMNKEPLRSMPVGQGKGRTAEAIFKSRKLAKPGEPLLVAHETDRFASYEAITRAHTGDPNVLISRDNVGSERAIHGDGFYTKAGLEGQSGKGLTIRFAMDPKSREGKDFTYVPGDEYFVIHNRNAIRVIPESLRIGPVEFFEMLARGNDFKASDQGILEKFKRRLDTKAFTLSPEDEDKILEIVNSAPIESAVLREWLDLKISQKHSEIVEDLISRNSQEIDDLIIMEVLGNPAWEPRPEWVKTLIRDRNGRLDTKIIRNVLTKPHWVGHPEIVKALLDQGGWRINTVAQFLLSLPQWKGHPEFVESILKTGDPEGYRAIAQFVVGASHWTDHPEWIQKLIQAGSSRIDRKLETYALSEPHWRDHPELRRIVRGAQPTVENLRQAFWRGESLLPKGKTSRDCREDFRRLLRASFGL